MTVQQAIKRVPSFMMIDTSRIETLDDVCYQCEIEIDNALAGSFEKAWTKTQIHRAKMVLADLRYAEKKASQSA